MKTLLAKKQAEEQKIKNENASYQFVIAMMNLDYNTISGLLKKNGVYLRKLNNWQFINWLKNKFSKLNPQMFHSRMKEEISLDYFPGSISFEFTYVPLDNIDLFDFDETNDKLYNIEGVFKIKLTILFNDGFIEDVRLSKSSININLANKLKLEN